jgi:hypothetical protein
MLDQGDVPRCLTARRRVRDHPPSIGPDPPAV